MALDDEFLKQIIETFRAELEEQSQAITDGLLKIEKTPAESKEFADEIVKVFRAAHNIKGSARGIGVADVGEIAHFLETLFLSIQKNTVAVNPDIINLCLQSVDCMRDAMQCFIDKKALNFDIKELLSLLQQSANVSEKPAAEDKKEQPAPAVTKAEDEPVQKASENPEPIPAKKIEPEPPKAPPPPVVATPAPVEPVKPVITAAAKPEQLKINEYESIRVSLYNLDKVSAYMEEMQINKIAIDDHYSELVKLNTKAKQFAETWKKSLDDFISLYGPEISENFRKVYNLSKEKLNEITSNINKMHKNMNAHINELTVVSNALQEEVRVLRLIPVTSLLRNLPRTVRDLGHDLHKQVDLKINDNDAKIDKIILEGIKDPIIHILRNAIDHGIESAEERKARGKPDAGSIKIDVNEESNQVVFVISDDGGGINLEKIKENALKKNIISKSEMDILTEDEIMDLIFKPGFSTKEVVTDVSGRGVGLDVVKANLANLRGHVSITTEHGKGTSFYLRVPLTLATERGLIVSCAKQLFVISTSSVERVLLLNKMDIIEVEKSQAILLDTHPVSLCALADILHFNTNKYESGEELPVVVIRKGPNLAALLVDEIIGEREIVIKPLKAPLINVPCVSGATLAGSGEIIMVLNVTDLTERALHSRKNIVVSNQNQINKTTTKPTILVVDDSLTTRNFVKNILNGKGYKVTTAADGKEAWDMLQKEKFSVLITDVEMPYMNGIELTEKVKKSTNLRDLPVIIVSSLDSDEQKKRGMDAGANAYIVKHQFESGELAKVVSNMV